MPDSSPFQLSGINGTTGGYLPSPASIDDLFQSIVPKSDAFLQAEATADIALRLMREAQVNYALDPKLDPADLGQTGWGILFPHGADPAIAEALRPLLDRRRDQAGKYFRIFRDAEGYRPNESKRAFLGRFGVGPGQPANPATNGIPYYLLLVGSPRAIPWRFQYELDVEYAVGRLWLPDQHGQPDIGAFRRYADAIVAAETKSAVRPRSVSWFATNHDPATQFSSLMLIPPIRASIENTPASQGWSFHASVAGEATKARLSQLLGGRETPGVLFTAGHGIAFQPNDPLGRQRSSQGALVCQDWANLADRSGAGSAAGYFGASDLPDGADLRGLIAFHFACFGAGTPKTDDFPDSSGEFRNAVLAEEPFVAQLPTRLLGHPNGGAQAIIGHVDRAWACSFLLDQRRPQTAPFTVFFEQLLKGIPIGHAMEAFNNRHAALSVELTSAFQDRPFSNDSADYKRQLATIWLENNDARNYVILGDPAAKVAGGSPGATSPVPTQTVATASPVSPIPAPPVPPVPPPASPTPSGTPFELPAGLTDRTDYEFVDPTAQVRVVVSRLDHLATDDDLPSVAWDYATLAGRGTRAAKVAIEQIPRPLPSGRGSYVEVTLSDLPPGAEIPVPVTERSAFIRFESGAGLRLARVGPSNEPGADAAWARLLASVEPAAAAAMPFAFSGSNERRTAAGCTFDLPGTYENPTRFRFTDEEGVGYHLVVGAPGIAPESFAPAAVPGGLYMSVGSTRGNLFQKIYFETVPDPWAGGVSFGEAALTAENGPQVASTADTPAAAEMAAALRAAFQPR